MLTFVKLKDYKNQPIYVNVNAIRTMRKLVSDGYIGTSIALPEKEIFVRGTPEDVLASIAQVKDR